MRKSDNGAIDDKTDKLPKSLEASGQPHDMMDKPCKPSDSDMMDKLVKPLDVDTMNKSTKSSGVQSEEEKSIPGEADDSHTKIILKKAMPGPVRLEESQLKCMKRCSTCICQSSTQMMESLKNQQSHDQKCRSEEEVDDDIENHPAQHLQANLVWLAVATELLIGDHEYNINEEVCVVWEKADIQISKSYSEAINNLMYGSK